MRALDNPLSECEYSQMFWIVFAAQLSAPQPIKMWFRNEDTPVKEIVSRGIATLVFRVTTNPQGKVHICEVEISSGNPRIDARTCQITMKRARFKPARSQDGTAAYGVFRMPISWKLDTSHSSSPEAVADLILEVNHLPRGTESPKNVRVAFTVDVTGRLLNCDGETLFGGQPEVSFANIACAQLLQKFIAIPAKNENGRQFCRYRMVRCCSCGTNASRQIFGPVACQSLRKPAMPTSSWRPTKAKRSLPRLGSEQRLGA